MENKVFNHLLHRSLLWEVKSHSCNEVSIITSFEHNNAQLLSGKLTFPPEFSVSSHPLSCPSEDGPVPFNSSFSPFPFQISVMRMKTKGFFLKRNIAQQMLKGITWAWVCLISFELKPRKLLRLQMSLEIMLKSEHIFKGLPRKSLQFYVRQVSTDCVEESWV